MTLILPESASILPLPLSAGAGFMTPVIPVGTTMIQTGYSISRNGYLIMVIGITLIRAD